MICAPWVSTSTTTAASGSTPLALPALSGGGTRGGARAATVDVIAVAADQIPAVASVGLLPPPAPGRVIAAGDRFRGASTAVLGLNVSRGTENFQKS